MVLYGPPGTGKTTLARLAAEHASAAFEELSAVNAGRAEVREVIARARERRGAAPAARRSSSSTRSTASTRPSRTRCCPRSRRGSLTLIGATTENPYFEVNSALLSRAQVYELQALDAQDLEGLLRRALERGRRRGDRGARRGHHVPRRALRRRRADGPERARAGGDDRAARRRSRASRSATPRTRCSARPCSTTRPATSTTTTSRPGSSRRAARTPTRRCTTSRR